MLYRTPAPVHVKGHPMPSTKVLWGALTALALQAAMAVSGNPAVLNVVPVQWRGLIATLIAALVAYYVKETRPAPSAIDAVNNTQGN